MHVNARGDDYILKIIKIAFIGLVMIGMICGMIAVLNRNKQSIYPDLPEKPIAFLTTEFVDTNDDAGYLVIEYNGRKYLPYGTIKRSIKENDIDQCIGYIIQDEKTSSMPDENNTDTRIYTLTEDKENNFLMQYYIGTHLMNQPDFWRADDTKEKNIVIPNYIDSLDYHYWK